MAAYQNENEKRKQELLKAFQQQQKLEEYQKNKSNLTDYIKQGNNYRTELGSLGKTLSNSDNALISNLGDKLYTGTGQKYIDNVVSKGTDTLQTGLSNLGNKLGNTLANSNSQLAQNLGSKLLSSTGSASSLGSGTTSALGSALGAETAGTTAAGTGSALESAIGAEAAGTLGSTGALTGAISSAAPMAGTAGASAAGTGALAAGLTNPVTAGIAAAAMIGSSLLSSKKQKNEQAMKLAQQSAEQGQNTALNAKNTAMQNLTQNQQDLDNTSQNQDNSQLINDLKNDYLNNNQTSNLQPQDMSKNESLNQTGINYPTDTQTLNNEGTDTIENTLSKYLNLGSNALGSLTGGAASLTDGISEILPENNSNDTKSALVKEIANAVNTGSEIPESVDFTPDTKQTTVSKIFDQFKQGYNENRNNEFQPENLIRTEKSPWNRVGEAIGTGARVLSNPALQGLIAGTVSGIANKDWSKGLEYGVKWAKDKAKSDMYEKMISGNNAASILGSGLSSSDYSAKVLGDYRDNMAKTNAEELAYKKNKDNITADEYYNNLYNAGVINEEQYQSIMNNPNYDGSTMINLDALDKGSNIQRRNNQNAKDVHDMNLKDEEFDFDKNYKNKQLVISQQNANTNTERLEETKRSNIVNESIKRMQLNEDVRNHDIQAGFRQAEIEIKKAQKSGDMTVNEQISIAKNTRDTAVNMIKQMSDKTDEEKAALVYEANYNFNKTLRNIGITKKQAKQAGISLDNTSSGDVLGIFDDNNNQFTVFEPTEPTTPPKPPKKVPVI